MKAGQKERLIWKKNRHSVLGLVIWAVFSIVWKPLIGSDPVGHERKAFDGIELNQAWKFWAAEQENAWNED